MPTTSIVALVLSGAQAAIVASGYLWGREKWEARMRSIMTTTMASSSN